MATLGPSAATPMHLLETTMCTARRASDPHSYRSPRTERWREVARSLGEAELYRRTGVQLMPINTIFQFAGAHRHELARAPADDASRARGLRAHG
jgi:hypothetical protein